MVCSAFCHEAGNMELYKRKMQQYIHVVKGRQHMGPLVSTQVF